MAWSAEAATVLRIVRVEAGSFELAARARIVVGISSRPLLTDDAEPITSKDLGAEQHLMVTVISTLAGRAASAVGGALMARASRLGALEQDRATGDRAELLH